MFLLPEVLEGDPKRHLVGRQDPTDSRLYFTKCGTRFMLDYARLPRGTKLVDCARCLLAL